MTLAYGSAFAQGYLATDLVCTRKDIKSCGQLQWFVLESGYGFEGIDGIVGLSTGNPPLTDGDIYIKKLYE